jgi:UDP-N-acetylglucosamine 1-carboxyvinyltransferase
MVSDKSIVEKTVSIGRLTVEGGRGLQGTVRISGFKHALVSLFAAACSTESSVVIHNCPAIAETETLIQLIQCSGGSASWEGDSLSINASGIKHGRLDPSVSNRIHGSAYLAPALVTRTGEAVIGVRGGCPIGDGLHGNRPVEHYVSIFEKFGAQARVDDTGNLHIKGKQLVGCDIDLLDFTSDRTLETGPLYSGASKMALLTAAVASGPSTLYNLYPKPDVTELVAFLRQLGVKIDGNSTHRLVVYGRGGVGVTSHVSYTLIGDLIEIVTWICAGAMLENSQLRIQGVGLARAVEALKPEMSIISQMGVPIEWDGETLVVRSMERGHAVDMVVTSPGIYSDSHPFLALLATACCGQSRITEKVWQNRFDYVQGLVSLGARIHREGASAVIHGETRPHIAGRNLRANDVRSAAVLLLAALTIDGITTIEGTHHLARGYMDFVSTLRELGAKIDVE